MAKAKSIPRPAVEPATTTVLSLPVPSAPSQQDIVNAFVRRMVAYTTDAAQKSGGLSTSDIDIALGRQGRLSYSVMDQIYEKCSPVRMVIDTIVATLIGLDWDITAEDPEDEVDEKTIQTVRHLFERPNTEDTYYSFMRKTLTDLCRYDVGAFEVARFRGSVAELVSVSGATVLPEQDANGRTSKVWQLVRAEGASYGQEKTFQPGINKIPFSPKDLRYFSVYPSNKTMFGLSPIETLTMEVAADLHALGYNANWFDEGFMFSKILVVPPMGKESFEKLRESFEGKRGERNSFPVVETASPEKAVLLDFAQTNKDMEYIQFEDYLLKRICAVFQVPANEVMELYQSATRASAEVQKKIAESKSIACMIRLIEGVFTDIVHEFDPRLKFDILPNRMTDTEKADLMTKKRAAGLSRNAAAKELGYATVNVTMNVRGVTVNPYDFPDDLLDKMLKVQWINAGVRPGASGGGPQEPSSADVLPEAVKSMVCDHQPAALKPVRKARKNLLNIDFSPPKRDDLNDTLRARISPLLRRVGAAALNIARSKALPMTGEAVAKADVPDWADSIAMEALVDAKFQAEFEPAVKVVLRDAMKKSGGTLLGQLGIELSDSAWDKVANDYYMDRFYNNGVLFDITDSLRNEIGKTIADAAREGTSVKGVMEAIEEGIGAIEPYEAERIARTETFMASHEGMMDTWSKVGVDSWELVNSPGACPVCAAVAYGGSPAEFGEVSDKVAAMNYKGNPYTSDEMEALRGQTGFKGAIIHPNDECVWMPWIEDRDMLEQVTNNAKELSSRLAV